MYSQLCCALIFYCRAEQAATLQAQRDANQQDDNKRAEDRKKYTRHRNYDPKRKKGKYHNFKSGATGAPWQGKQSILGRSITWKADHYEETPASPARSEVHQSPNPVVEVQEQCEAENLEEPGAE